MLLASCHVGYHITIVAVGSPSAVTIAHARVLTSVHGVRSSVACVLTAIHVVGVVPMCAHDSVMGSS